MNLSPFDLIESAYSHMIILIDGFQYGSEPLQVRRLVLYKPKTREYRETVFSTKEATSRSASYTYWVQEKLHGLKPGSDGLPQDKLQNTVDSILEGWKTALEPSTLLRTKFPMLTNWLGKCLQQPMGDLDRIGCPLVRGLDTGPKEKATFYGTYLLSKFKDSGGKDTEDKINKTMTSGTKKRREQVIVAPWTQLIN